MAERIAVIPKTELTFDGRAGSTQTVILKERIPTAGVVSGVLEVRLHSHAGLSNSAQANIQVVNETFSRDEPGTFFTPSGVGSEVASVAINNQLTFPSLLVDPFTPPIVSMVRVRIEWLQGVTAAGGPQKIVIGADLVVRASG